MIDATRLLSFPEISLYLDHPTNEQYIQRALTCLGNLKDKEELRSVIPEICTLRIPGVKSWQIESLKNLLGIALR